MVQTVMGFLDDTPNLDVKMSVIETLRTVTEGKVSLDTLYLLYIHPSLMWTLRYSSKLRGPG